MAVSTIDDTIKGINDIQRRIATTVMAQKDTTNDIVKTISTAAKGGVEIAEHIADVAAGAEQVMDSAQAVELATIELHIAATELSHCVDRFQTD